MQKDMAELERSEMLSELPISQKITTYCATFNVHMYLGIISGRHSSVGLRQEACIVRGDAVGRAWEGGYIHIP